MDQETLQAELEATGELMVAVEKFEEPIELHLHDADIGTERVRLELADGTLTFSLDAIAGYWEHYHSLEDYGLE